MSQPEQTTTTMEGPPEDALAGRLSMLGGLALRVMLPFVFLGVGLYIYSILSVETEKEKEEKAADQLLRTSVLALQVADRAVVIRSNGIVQPINEVTLSAQVSGQITFVSPSFEAGSYFSEGELLVQLDDRDYVTAVAVAQAQQKSAESALAFAKQNHLRNLRLYENQVVSISEAEVNQSDAQVAQAEAELDSAIAVLEQAKRDLERTRIAAPYDGRVRQKAVGLGQTVGPGTALGVAFAVDFAEVRLPIAPRDLQFIDLPELPDDPPIEVELRDAINSANATVWSGMIVRTEGALDVDSLAVYAVARVADPFGRESTHPPLRIGQPVVGSIVGETLRDVVALPRAAVRQLDQIILIDAADLTISQKTIEAVWSDEERVYVRDPLIGDGTLLATTHLVYAPEGSKVEIIPDIQAPEGSTALANVAAPDNDSDGSDSSEEQDMVKQASKSAGNGKVDQGKQATN